DRVVALDPDPRQRLVAGVAHRARARTAADRGRGDSGREPAAVAFHLAMGVAPGGQGKPGGSPAKDCPPPAPPAPPPPPPTPPARRLRPRGASAGAARGSNAGASS